MCNPVETKYQCGQCIVNGGQHKDTVVVGAMTRVDRAVRLTLVTLQALQRQVRDVRLCNLTTTDTAWELRAQICGGECGKSHQGQISQIYHDQIATYLYQTSKDSNFVLKRGLTLTALNGRQGQNIPTLCYRSPLGQDTMTRSIDCHPQDTMTRSIDCHKIH